MKTNNFRFLLIILSLTLSLTKVSLVPLQNELEEETSCILICTECLVEDMNMSTVQVYIIISYLNKKFKITKNIYLYI